MVDTIERNPDVTLCEQYEGRRVLFDPVTGAGFELNDVGVFVWRHLDGHHSSSDIVRAMQRKFHQVPAEAAQDVEDLIRHLIDRGLAGHAVPLRQ